MDPEQPRRSSATSKIPRTQRPSIIQRLRGWRKKPVESLHDYLEPPTGHSLETVEESLELKRQPPRTDPRHADRSVPEGQDDVPAGGTSGGEMRGGGKRPAG